MTRGSRGRKRKVDMPPPRHKSSPGTAERREEGVNTCMIRSGQETPETRCIKNQPCHLHLSKFRCVWNLNKSVCTIRGVNTCMICSGQDTPETRCIKNQPCHLHLPHCRSASAVWNLNKSVCTIRGASKPDMFPNREDIHTGDPRKWRWLSSPSSKNHKR